MNRYLLIDEIANTISSLGKVETNFKENETQTSSIACKDKVDLLNSALDMIKEEIENYAEEKDIRICSKCGHLMYEGYIDSDFHYYCSDECLHKDYTDEEWKKLCEKYEDDFYWTEWR